MNAPYLRLPLLCKNDSDWFYEVLKVFFCLFFPFLLFNEVSNPQALVTLRLPALVDFISIKGKKGKIKNINPTLKSKIQHLLPVERFFLQLRKNTLSLVVFNIFGIFKIFRHLEVVDFYGFFVYQPLHL